MAYLPGIVCCKGKHVQPAPVRQDCQQWEISVGISQTTCRIIQTSDLILIAQKQQDRVITQNQDHML